MKLEHEMTRMHQDRQQEESERAERQRREERVFQLELFSMLYGQQRSNLIGQQFYYPSNSGCSSSDGDYRSDNDYYSDGGYHSIDCTPR